MNLDWAGTWPTRLRSSPRFLWELLHKQWRIVKRHGWYLSCSLRAAGTLSSFSSHYLTEQTPMLYLVFSLLCCCACDSHYASEACVCVCVCVCVHVVPVFPRARPLSLAPEVPDILLLYHIINDTHFLDLALLQPGWPFPSSEWLQMNLLHHLGTAGG